LGIEDCRDFEKGEEMKKIGMIGLGFVLGFVGLVQARDLRTLLSEEKAAQFATHVIVIDYTDVTGVTASNTAATISFTNAIAANSAVVGVRYELPQVWAATNSAMNSAALTVGVQSALTNIMKSTEMCVDGTEVYNKWGPSDLATVYTTATNLVVTVTPANVLGMGLSTYTSGQARVYFKMHALSTRLE
jgi:phosphohistidine swiveling domain-containing protein